MMELLHLIVALEVELGGLGEVVAATDSEDNGTSSRWLW